MSLRAVKSITETVPTIEGAGVKLQRAFGVLPAPIVPRRATAAPPSTLWFRRGDTRTAMVETGSWLI